MVISLAGLFSIAGTGGLIGQTKWKSYVKGPGVTYTVSTTVAAKTADGGGKEKRSTGSPQLADPAGLAEAWARLCDWNRLVASVSGSVSGRYRVGPWQ